MSLKKVFAVIGAPGSGKGTVCNAVMDDAHHVVSTRDLLEKYGRSHIIQEAQLAPDDLICSLLIEELRLKNNIVLIDTLRSTQQCHTVLWEFLTLDMGVPVTTIHLDVNEEVALQRMQERGRCDDNKAAERLRQYQEYGPKVLGWLNESTDVRRVNASLPMLEVVNAFKHVIEIQTTFKPTLEVLPDIRNWQPLTAKP